MEESFMEKREGGVFPVMTMTRGKDAKGPVPSTAVGDGKGTVTVQNMKQDKEVAHSAPPSASGDPGKWETHIARKTKERLGTEERRRIRQVAFQLGPDLLKRMSEDRELMECVHERIKENHFLGLVMKDRFRKNEEVPELIRSMSGTLTEGLRRYVQDKRKEFSIPEECVEPLVRFGMWLALVGGESLIGKGDRKDA